MKYSETIAIICRYGDCAAKLLDNAEIIWEDSHADYQGSANLLAFLSDGQFIHLEWSYGSCSDCDGWEAENLSDEEIIKEMKKSAVYFDRLDILQNYLNGTGMFSIKSMKDAFDKWWEKNKEKLKCA